MRNILICIIIWISTSFALSEDYSGVIQIDEIFDCWYQAYSSTAVDNYLYIAGGGAGLWIVDLDSLETDNWLVSRCDTPGEAADIEMSGDYAYLAAKLRGLYVIDVSDPYEPEIVSNFDTWGNSYNLAKEGNRIYIADGSRGLRIIDVSDPTTPEELGFYNRIGTVFDVAISDEIAYLATGHVEGLKIIDVSDPYRPDLISHSNIGGYSYIKLYENNAYLWRGGGGLNIFNVLSPDDPIVQENPFSEIRMRFISFGDEIAYVLTSDSGLYVFDYFDMDNPELLDRLSINKNWAFQECGITENRVFISSKHHGVHIIDASDPENLNDLGFYGADHLIEHLEIFNNLLFTCNRYNGFGIVDITDPLQPMILNYQIDDRSISDIVISDTLAFITDINNGLIIADISIPDTILELGHYQTVGEATDIELYEENYALVADYPYGIDIINVSEPTHPNSIAYFHWEENSEINICVNNGFAYFVNWKDYMIVVDLSDPYSPHQISQWNSPLSSPIDRDCLIDLIVSENIAFLTSFLRGLWLVDIDNPANPITISRYELDDHSVGIDLNGNYAYIASERYVAEIIDDVYNSGIRIVNISDPYNPHEVGYNITYHGATDIAVKDGYIFAAIKTGIGVFDPTEALAVNGSVVHIPNDFSLLNVYPNPFNSSAIICFSIPGSSPVSIDLYDLSGRKVRTLMQPSLLRGNHRIELDSNDLAGGCYYIHLNYGGKNVTEKIQIIK